MFSSADLKDRKHERYFGNCSYLGDNRTIACDITSVDKLIDYYDLDKTEQVRSDTDGHIVERWLEERNSLELQRDYETLMVWVLAHELGHLLSGHVGQFYFANHKSTTNFDIKNYCHKLEFEADSFAISLLSEEKVEDYYLFLYDLINRELHGLACPGRPKIGYCENIYPGTGLAITDDIIEYVVDGTHPEFSIRVLRMAELAQEKQDFGLFAYQLDQLLRTKVSIASPNDLNDPCLRD